MYLIYLVYLLHCILRIFSNIIEAHLQLHQILCHHPNQAPPKAFTCVGVRNRQELVPIVLFPCPTLEWSSIHFQLRSRYIWYTFFSFYHSYIFLGMMDRPSTSTNPLFLEQDNDMSSYITKSHLFGAQRALHQEQQAMSERIDNLAADLRLSEQRTRDNFDHKLNDHKKENDARMDEIRVLLLNRSSSTLSSSRRTRSSRHSNFTLSGSSTPTSSVWEPI